MEKLIVSASPHIRAKRTTTNIMLDVIIALIPALIAGVILQGIRALAVIAVSVASSVLFEYLSRKLMKRSNTIGDLSAVVTGLLLAMNLPVTFPLWMTVIGAFIAIVLVKQLFGGIGQNFANPAIAARVILLISFTSQMTTWAAPIFSYNVDAIAGATPLVDLSRYNVWELFLGNVGGCIGETSTLALLIGGIYLLIRRVITLTIPTVYIGSVFLLSFLLGEDPLKQILAGGLMLGAFFMATDYTTSPMTEWGKAIFALGCGILTVLIRQFGNYPEGVSFAILFMNMLVPFIDRGTRRKALGGGKPNESD